MKTIKAFYKDEKGYYCQPDKEKFYFEEGKTYKMNKKRIKMGKSGFHASANFDISDTLLAYGASRAHYGIVELNVIHADIWIAVGNAITILEFLPRDFNILSKYDKTGGWVYFVGSYWENFDYNLGFKKLLEIDKTGGWVYHAGCDWENFDYNLGLKKLLEIDRTGGGGWVNLAKKDWKIFKQQTEK
jgi:hypothetical protein